MSISVAVEAPAKVNLFLRILGKRADGFHDIETVFQAVDLCDEIILTPTAGGVELAVDGPDLGTPERNLAVRAARAFLDVVHGLAGVRIELIKRIPAGAGLGGGSSDAAAVLRGLGALAPEPPGALDLARMGAALGSDVAFFLGSSPLALGRGRGERIEPLEPLEERAVVLVLPPVHVATASAYQALDELRATGVGLGDGERRLPRAHPRTWADPTVWAHNEFETVVPGRYPEVARSLAAVSDRGGRPTLLSGSGAACFGLFSDRTTAERSAQALSRELGWPALATHTLRSFPVPQTSVPG